MITIDIIISNSSGEPIYEQIYAQIKNQIISDKLKSGDMLPSIRSLAKDLRISVITTKRAYDELERGGFIYTSAGRGCFVAEKNTELIREENLKKIEEYLSEISKLAVMCGLNREDIISMFDILEENKKG